MACMQAVERGLLKLDEPVDKLLPHFADLDIIDGSEGDDVKLRKAKYVRDRHLSFQSEPVLEYELADNVRTLITLRMLLAHTAGFSYSWYHADLCKWVKQQNLKFSDELHLSPLVNEPGTKWEYGMSMDWAGAVLEAATGKSLGQWAKGQ